MNTPRTEFAEALKAIATERGLDPDVILDTIKQAIIAAYRRDAKDRGEDTEEMDFDVEINPSSGEAKVFAWPLEKPEERKDVTPPGFGRIAAQTAKQVIHQKIREAEKSSIMDEYGERVGSLVSGTILRFDGPNVRVDMGRTEGIMPAEERIATERLSLNQRLTFLLKEIKEGLRGKELVLSRADAEFVKKLFAREVPEIGSSAVEIKSIAREAGVRTKMTVASSQTGVDPVGSCVGQKGVRVQAVTNELGGERVDIIPWTEDLTELIKAAMAPAEGIEVELDKAKKVATVKVPEDQLSMAIGRDGQNARLTAKLTGVRIEVEGIPGTSKKEETAEEEEEEKKEDVPNEASPAQNQETKEKPKEEAIKEEKKETEEVKEEKEAPKEEVKSEE
jgi:N utilization substance protein A